MKTTHMLNGIILILVSVLLLGCKTTNKFASPDIHLGVSKEQVMAKFGKPYKVFMEQLVLPNNETVDVEELIYSQYHLLSNYYSYVILTFENGKLIKMEQTDDIESYLPPIMPPVPYN